MTDSDHIFFVNIQRSFEFSWTFIKIFPSKHLNQVFILTYCHSYFLFYLIGLRSNKELYLHQRNKAIRHVVIASNIQNHHLVSFLKHEWYRSWETKSLTWCEWFDNLTLHVHDDNRVWSVSYDKLIRILRHQTNRMNCCIVSTKWLECWKTLQSLYVPNLNSIKDKTVQ